jgi:shikimate kinase/3-dehydroquinate synthase
VQLVFKDGIGGTMSDNVILTGFMGTGKTTVGQVVARRLGRSFVDMDVEIEARAGKSIPAIFAEDGQSAFRRLEAAYNKELSGEENLVIATGGGALVDPVNRALMEASGVVICLTCDACEILERVKAAGDCDRPLLDVPDPCAEIEALLGARREAYQAIPWHIDTTGLSVEQVTARVIEIAETVTLPVQHPGGEYPIHVGNGLLEHAGGALLAAGVPEGSAIALVSNPVVAPLYGARVERALRTAGFRPFVCTVLDGEQHKTLATVAALYDQFLSGGLDRSGTVLSLGGGVTGDEAGFAAATFMRGVSFVQMPTTLLAMVDASVGSKTGVDLGQGKNLVGAFKQPEVVIVDPTVLTTLPGEEIRSGMAEVIKHGIIGAPDLFARLESGEPGSEFVVSGSDIALALRVKIEIVAQDPFEQGRRAVLNLGHTVGHALERLSGFERRHGEAVSVGMVAAARIAADMGRAAPSLADRIEAALLAWGLPIQCPPFDAEVIQEAMAHDKKRRGGVLRWVLPREIGVVEIVEDVPAETVLSVLRGLGAS